MICSHGLDESFCGVCRYLLRAAEPLLVEERTFALTEESCAACPHPITIGQEAVKFNNGWIQHAHHQPPEGTR